METQWKKTKRPLNPRAKAGFFSRLTYRWTFDLFLKGYKRDLKVNDLYMTLDDHSSSMLGNNLQRNWDAEIANARTANRRPSLKRAVAKTFGREFLILGVTQAFFEIVVSILMPICVKQIIAYFTPGKDVSLKEVYIYTGMLVILNIIIRTVTHDQFLSLAVCGMKMKVALCSVVYKKALRLNKNDLGGTTTGQIVNLISNDVNRFDNATILFHYLWIAPLQMIIISYILWFYLNTAVFAGVGVLLLAIPIQGYLGMRTSRLRLKTAVRTDERVRLMSEIISGIQVIKMYTWELPFIKLIEKTRKLEMNEIRAMMNSRGILSAFVLFQGKIALFLSLLLYVTSGNTINSETVFVTSMYLATLGHTLILRFPIAVTNYAEVAVSMKRLETFLFYGENEALIRPITAKQNSVQKTRPGSVTLMQILNKGKEFLDIKNLTNETLPSIPTDEEHQKYSIIIKNVKAKWNKTRKECCLNNVNMHIKRGKLTAIIGPVGSSKTTLLYAILRELEVDKGIISISGTVSYASQEPWLFGGSVRQNILFGLPMNRQRYDEVVGVCALKTDFQQLPYGDRTTVSDRGGGLSGGQKARITLARTVYKEADIYLLDDPLSAVDTQVGMQLFHGCIKEYLRDKTRVLITHQLQYLSDVDEIFLLEKGVILMHGSFQQLTQSGLNFTTHMKAPNVDGEDHQTQQETSIIDEIKAVDPSLQNVTDDNIDRNPPIFEESTTSTKASLGFYEAYFSFGGNFLFVFLVFFTFAMAIFFGTIFEVWLSYWVNLEDHYSLKNDTFYPEKSKQELTDLLHEDRKKFIFIFGVITCFTMITALLAIFVFVKLCTNASIRLHNYMFKGVVRAPVYFFYSNSAGRILNRFSKDIGQIDELLPVALNDCIQVGLMLLGVVVIILLMNVWLLIPTVLMFFIFYLLRNFYIVTSKSIKRLEAVTRSPVFSHLNTTLIGLATIRAFHAQAVLQREFDNHQDLHSSAWYLFLATSRAYGFWLDMVNVVYIAVVAFSFITFSAVTSGSLVGLAITQALSITGRLQWGMRQSSELDNQMTSIERIVEYGEIEPEEGKQQLPIDPVPENWPSRGEIKFQNAVLRYSKDGPYAIKNLTVLIKSQEKVGIVGRTGAGKSSIIAALFRMGNNEGKILIDGMDINKMRLQDVRSKLSIIPQEPTLFSGTMRKNLDPFDQYGDDILWKALEEAKLKELISSMPGRLGSSVSQSGINFSVGEKQLVCLARAIVNKNKILILDEATANVDPQTDALIQVTIKENFSECTVLTIAHRLNTVMDSDRILVMNQGELVEFDHAHILLQNKKGIFYDMVKNTGRSTAYYLRKTAAQHYRNMQEKQKSTKSDDKLVKENL